MINIVSSGSAGNAVLYYDNELLIDTGVAYKSLEEYLPQVKLILLTHIHGDHFNPATIRTICARHPKIFWVVPHYLKQEFLQLIKPHTKYLTVRENRTYKAGSYKIEVAPLYHDVPNVGYMIEKNNYKIVHATDTNIIRHVVAREYDLYAIECNFDEELMADLIKDELYKDTYTYQLRAKENHLSLQKTLAWYHAMRGENSRLVPLHISHSFDEKKLQESMEKILISLDI